MQRGQRAEAGIALSLGADPVRTRTTAHAVHIARKRGSRSLELRATLSLHALASGAKKKRARENVARLLSVLTEGHDTPDLVDALALVRT